MNKKHLPTHQELQEQLAYFKNKYEQLQQSQSKSYEQILNKIPDAIVRFDRNLRYVYANEATLKFTGKKPEELLNKTFKEAGFPEEFSELWNQKHLEVFKTGKPLEFDFSYTTADNRNRNFLAKIEPEFDRQDKNQVATVLVAIRDITSLKKTELALKETERKYRELTQNVNDIIYVLDTEGHLKFVNNAFERLFRLPKEKVLGKHFSNLMNKETREKNMEIRNQLLKGEKPSRFEITFDFAPGDEIILEFSTSPMLDDKKRLKGVLGIARDITHQKKAEARLAESEELYRSLVQTMDEGVILYNSKGKVVSFNRAAAAKLQTENQQKYGLIHGRKGIKTIYESGELFPEKEYPLERTLKENKAFKNVIMGIVENNHTTWLKLNTQPLFLSEKKEMHALLSFSDITELKQKEEKLREANTTKDKFFSIIAHDLKSPFNSIMGFSQLLTRNIEDERKAEKYAQIILNESQSAVNLLTNLMEWSRSQSGTIQFEPEAFNLYDVIDQITALFNSSLAIKQIELKLNVEEKLLIFADQNMVKTIIRNLLSNAIKYSNENDTISIEAVRKVGQLIFSVKDNGVGIPIEHQEQLLKPNSTISTPGTKNEKGTGLGLSICKEFVDHHKGKISIDSQPGKGTTFIVALPQNEK